jgi:hypothetical protein
MARSFKVRLAIGTVVALALGGSVAWATFVPTVLYKPPVIKAKDHESHMSEEHVIISLTKDGKSFSFGSSPAPFTIDPGSDSGCDNDVTVTCPKKGVRKIIVLLGAMNDSADIALGSSADKVKQIMKGEDGNDDLTGLEGAQKLSGGQGNDELRGGPGKDVLLGGPGTDVCISGPGKDVVKDCEPVPMR